MEENESQKEVLEAKAQENPKKSRFLRLFKPLLRIWQYLTRFLRRFGAFLKRRWLPIGCVLFGFAVLTGSLIGGINAAVCHQAKDRIVSAEALSDLGIDFDYILVLGCRVYDDGQLSHMLEDRVTVGVSLYQNGACDRLLMSGDNQTDDYNEVDPMKAAAVALGVPAEAIICDPYGLSTYDSLARVRRNFDGKRIVIVTQTYHLYRAIYIAEKLGIEAYGVSADLRPYSGQSGRDAREVLARCKDVFYSWAEPTPAGDATPLALQ